MQRVRAGAIVAEVHVELTAPRDMIWTGLAIVLLQTDTRCRRRSNELSHSFSGHLVLGSNHFLPLWFALARPPPLLTVMSVYTEYNECTLYMNDEDSSENCAAALTENRKHYELLEYPSGPET